MSVREGIGSTKTSSLEEMLAAIPEGQLDVSEIEGGLTWRQAMLLGLTRGYLRIPGDETEDQADNPRLQVRRTVDSAFRANVAANGRPESAKAVMVFCLEIASAEYASLCESAPEWENDRAMVDELLGLWRDEDLAYMSEILAGNVLYYMYPPTDSSST